MATKFTNLTIGVNLNAMTSKALASYAKALSTDIKTLEGIAEPTSKQRKQLKEKLNMQKVVVQQNKRITSFYAELNKLGVNVGSLRNYSLNLLGDDALEQAIGHTNETDIKNVVKKYTSKTATVLGTDTIPAYIQGGLKLAGITTMAIAGGVALNGAINSIGSIKLPNGSSLGKTVAEFMGNHMPWFKGTVIAIAIGTAIYTVGKKWQEFENQKNKTIAEAMEHQFEAEDEMVERAKTEQPLSINELVARAETDSSYLNTLKETIKGYSVEDILKEGPASGTYTAAQYNAARILQKVQTRAASGKDAKSALKQQIEDKAVEALGDATIYNSYVTKLDGCKPEDIIKEGLGKEVTGSSGKKTVTHEMLEAAAVIKKANELGKTMGS